MHLVVVQAQSTTHTWKGSPTSDDWADLNNWDCTSNPSTVPDDNSIVSISSIPAGHKYPKLTASSHAKVVTIEANASLDLSTFVIIKADTYPCQIINKGTLKLEGTANQKTWFNMSAIHTLDKI